MMEGDSGLDWPPVIEDDEEELREMRITAGYRALVARGVPIPREEVAAVIDAADRLLVTPFKILVNPFKKTKKKSR